MADLPLTGLTFLNTRDAANAGALSRLLVAQGGTVLACPMIELAPPADWAPFDRRLDALAPGDWIVLTSANAVRALAARLAGLGRPADGLNVAEIAAIGGRTAAVAAEAGLSVRHVPPTAQQESLLASLLSELAAPARIWIPRAEEAREVLEQGLREAGHTVEITPVYRTVAPTAGLGPARDALLGGGVDWVLFTSPSTVVNFFTSLDGALRESLERNPPRIACIGAVTAEAVRVQGATPDVVPQRQELDAMVEAVVHYVRTPDGHRPDAV